jgi:hypothetical protein
VSNRRRLDARASTSQIAKHQIVRKGIVLTIFVSLARKKLFGLFDRLRRIDVFALWPSHSRPRHNGGNLTKVTPVPVAELWSAFLPSDNGGAYDRTSETLIIGPPCVRDPIDNAPKAMIAPPPFGVACIDDAIVCGEGIIWKKTSSGADAAAETLINAVTPRSILPLTRSAEGLLHVDETICLRRLSTKHTYAFLRQISDNNYGHWITEGLPKVAVLADHFDIKSLKFIVTRHFATRQSGPMRKIYLDSLAMLGIERHQIVPLTRAAVEVEHLLYPLPLTVHPWVKAPRSIQILEGLRDKIAIGQKGPRRIYVSRAGARKRRLLNEAEIVQVLRDFEVAVIYPERHSFIEQVRLFADAELIIGNYGANLTNLVFAPRGVKIFALTSETISDDFFWDLANLKSGKYFSLHGKAACASPDMNSDFFIDVREFRALLEEQVLKDR